MQHNTYFEKVVMKTKNLNFRLLNQNQAAKEVVVNENFLMLDAITNKAAISICDALPEEVNYGDIYIMSPNALDYKHHIMIKSEDSFQKLAPTKNMLFYIADKKCFYLFDGNSWIEA